MSVSDITNSYEDSYNDSQPYSQPANFLLVDAPSSQPDNFVLVDDPAPSLTNEFSSLFPSKSSLKNFAEYCRFKFHPANVSC
jgi:hypothetical protein